MHPVPLKGAASVGANRHSLPCRPQPFTCSHHRSRRLRANGAVREEGVIGATSTTTVVLAVDKPTPVLQELLDTAAVASTNGDGTVTFMFDASTSTTLGAPASTYANPSRTPVQTPSTSNGRAPTTPTAAPDSSHAAAQQQQQAPPVPAPSPPPAGPSSSRVDITYLDERAAAMHSERPLIPPLDVNFIVEALFGAPGARPELSALFHLAEQGTAPRLYTPGLARPPGSPPASTLPLLVYLPGIDGTGLAAYRQFPALLSRFDLRALFIPPQDRSSYKEVVARVSQLLVAEICACDPSRPVYLLGESFGGLVALTLAHQMPGAIDRIVLVNPATSFADSPWKVLGNALTALPSPIYNALPIALSPLLANPIAMAMHGVNPDAPLIRQVSDGAYALLDLMPELKALRQALPPDTLAWRLNLLQQGSQQVAGIINKVPQRTLLLVGQLDLVIPSNSEGPRLQKLMQRCRLKVLPLRSHAMLQEAGVKLVDILDEEGFYQGTRDLSSGLRNNGSNRTASTSQPGQPSSSASAAAAAAAAGSNGAHATYPATSSSSFDQRAKAAAATAAATTAAAPPAAGAMAAGPRVATPAAAATPATMVPQSAALDVNVAGGANFGLAAPLQLPTDKELQLAMEAAGLSNLKKLVSPVYFSTDAVTGRVQRGLGAIPESGTRPLLFVGNHQLLAPDTPLMVGEFLQERRMLLRGLTHPQALQLGSDSFDDPTAALLQTNSPFGSFLKTFGAVQVGGTNLYKLLSLNEAVLLYPGGAREATKRKGEKYTLLWPRRQEFVRMACRFGATIVPFAAIGAEDSVEILQDGEELLEVPLLGDWLRAQINKRPMPVARRGVNAISEEEAVLAESNMVPLLLPKAPARYYFLFSRPIETDPSMVRDRAACDALYASIKGEVEAGLRYLQDKREEDEYADFVTRILHETARGGMQAPTFEP